MPAQEDSYTDLNKIDRYAARVFTLAVKFFGASAPLASSTIRHELYAELDERSFNRQFLRDRNMLASLGIIVREVPSTQGDALWCVDERASYVQDDALGGQEARILYVLCHDLVFDQAFPYREELRVALIKIAQICQTTAIPSTGRTDATDRKTLAALVAAMASHEALDIRYVDAAGRSSTRTIALLGSFGLREHTYFVASRIGSDGLLVPDSVRTYRLDRFRRVSPVRPALSYHIPEDFSVRDYIRLPFQIGEGRGVARIALGQEPPSEVQRAIGSHGRLLEDGTWEVPYSSEGALASWCVANDLMPLAPTAVTEAYQQVRAAAGANTPYDPRLAEFASQQPRVARPRGTASSDAITKVRQLIALAGSLTQEGEVITAEQVSQALSVSYEQARHLIMLATMGSGESFDYLPLVIDDEYRAVFLMEGAQLSVPRLRLTRSETLALSAALTELGVSPDDPLARTLAGSYAAPAFSEGDVAASLNVGAATCNVDDLRICSQAISRGRTLRFVYRPVVGSATTRRHVVPQVMRHSGDDWYLDAFDLVRQDTRVFRVDRMSAIEEAEEAPEVAPVREPQSTRMVTVRFSDPTYLDLFHWEGMEVLSRRGDVTVARLPHYGGTWLARHLAACAGTVTTDDEDLAAQVTHLVRTPL